MGCNNKQYSGLNDVLDLNVKYTGCEFTIDGKTIKQGDNLRKVLDLILQNLGLSTSGSNFWFGLVAPSENVEAKDLDYYLQSDGSVWQLSNNVWNDTGITIGGGSGPSEPTEWGSIIGDINLQTDLITLINSIALSSSKIGTNINLDSSGKLNLGIDLSEIAPGMQAVVLSYNGDYPSDGSSIMFLKDSINVLTKSFEITDLQGNPIFSINQNVVNSNSIDFLAKNISCNRINITTGSGSESSESSLQKTFISNLRLAGAGAPSSATSAGEVGTIKWDNGFIYVCVALNTWKRAPLSTW